MYTGLCIQDSIECFFLLIGRSDYPFLTHFAWGNTLFCFPQNICAFVPCSTYFIVTYNLKFCSPLMASSMQFSSKALYRESGPSRDGDPVQGNLPFCLNFFLTFFSQWYVLIPISYKPYKYTPERKYTLTVVDVWSRFKAAEPLTSKTFSEFWRAFQTIYKRGLLRWPKALQVDPGVEFTGEVTKEIQSMVWD